MLLNLWLLLVNYDLSHENRLLIFRHQPQSTIVCYYYVLNTCKREHQKVICVVIKWTGKLKMYHQYDVIGLVKFKYALKKAARMQIHLLYLSY